MVISGIWAFAFTYGMLWLINVFTPVRVDPALEDRMDEELHGEDAYESALI